MQIFFQNWSSLGRTLIVAVLAYAALLVLLRVSGKRTLSKMNAFDFVVTVALGSTLATILLSKDVALAEGVLAFALLIGMQFLITWLSVRSQAVARFVKSDPSLIFYRGNYLEEALKRERVTESEVRAAVRDQGVADLATVEAVVLETDGSFTVITSAAGREVPFSALQGVGGHPRNN